MQSLWRLGEQYQGPPLDPSSCDPDPFVEVQRWLAVAIDGGIPSANAMTLATVGQDNRPAARIVLLKELDQRGFVFHTSYEGRKARDLAAHPYAALVLWWEPLHRQIRVEGRVEQIAAAESDAYFSTRPRGSQLGAIASPQSQVISSRQELEARVIALQQTYGTTVPPRPANWGGYRVVPDMIELWQGQPSRLHDRVRYTLTSPGAPSVWQRERLAP
jgi:pyridoxamine 5'-phosphate oxidase